MANFPSIQKPSQKLFGQQLSRHQVKTGFEGGTVQSFPKHTSSRWVFTLGWAALPDADFISLYQHFDQNQGTTFNYTHPLTSTVYSVRYADDALPNAVSDGLGHWALSGLRLEEA